MKRVVVKEEACIGCHLCEVFCKLQHAASKDLVKAFKRASQPLISRARVEEKGVVSFSLRCQQCDDAPCISACLTGALSREPLTNVIQVDEQKCMGCWTCLLVCPFGVIQCDLAHEKAVKCDLCQGEELPACVANCPNEALVYIQ
jgi:anaerobic carbon-monoxide dehydrogenase iron sulfur subunit